MAWKQDNISQALHVDSSLAQLADKYFRELKVIRFLCVRLQFACRSDIFDVHIHTHHLKVVPADCCRAQN